VKKIKKYFCVNYALKKSHFTQIWCRECSNSFSFYTATSCTTMSAYQHFSTVCSQGFLKFFEINSLSPVKYNLIIIYIGTVNWIRGHRRKFSGQYSKNCVQKANFFTNRMVSEWKALPASVIEPFSVNQSRYDAFKAIAKMIPSTNPAY